MYSHTKPEFCGLHTSGVTAKCLVFMLSFGQTDGQTDTQEDRQTHTPVKQYAPIFCGGIKIQKGHVGSIVVR